MDLVLLPSPPHGKVLLWELMDLRETQAGKIFLDNKSIFTLIGLKQNCAADYFSFKFILKC